MSTEETSPAPADRVERDIHVAASPEQVWELVSRPAWWVNDGEIDDHPVLRTEGDLTTLEHPEWGEFTIRTVAVDRPGSVSFRWVPAPSEDVPDDSSTLVEITVQAEPGGTRLRVVESGFAGLSDDPDAWQAQLTDNGAGWQNELRAARDFVTAHRG